MGKQNHFKKIKDCTVALALMHEDMHKPFTIIGSGFCIHPRGIIVTCQHVFSAFMSKTIPELIEKLPKDLAKRIPIDEDVEIITPNVLFFKNIQNKLAVFPVPIDLATIKADYDIGIVRLLKHTAFENGYPYLEIEDYDRMHEGMEIALCGFPLGNYLAQQLGTMTSSFTRGMLSSIIPMSGCSVDLLKGFQLDVTATYGNSGGPVFVPDNGKVFGILQGGVFIDKEKTTILQGIAKAEPIYPLFTGYNFIEDMVSAPETAEGIKKWTQGFT